MYGPIRVYACAELVWNVSVTKQFGEFYTHTRTHIYRHMHRPVYVFVSVSGWVKQYL